jgi:hypothetical protein
MADIWNNLLKTILFKKNLIAISAANSFIGTLSQLQPEMQSEIVQLTIKAAATVAADDSTINSLSHQFNNLLAFTQSEYVDSISLGLIAAFLSYETWKHLKLWWDDEISGEQCAKKIINSLAGVAGGIGGGYLGSTIGKSIVTGIGSAMGKVIAPIYVELGSVIGSVAGAAAGAMAASKFSDWATEKIFKLTKEDALKNVYNFMGLDTNASIDEINSSYTLLASKYNPYDENGNEDDWKKLQLSMGVITVSKG